MKTSSLKLIRLVPCMVMLAGLVAFNTARASDTDENRGQLNSSDYKFAKEAASGGMFEVNLGNMASANSKNAQVQQFGQRMVKDHTQANDNLKQIAERKGATLPTQLTSHQQREVDRLAKMSGPEFDKAYMSLMVRAHKSDERLFKKASEDAQDADIKNFASTTLTMVQEHLKLAQDLETSVKNEVSFNDR